MLQLCAMIFFFASCAENLPYTATLPISDAFFKGEVVVEKIEKLGQYRISIANALTGEKDRIHTPYNIFYATTGDINHDGRTDICIGIIKPTPFDNALKKRLFIFQIDRDYIRPLWLGSRLAHPMEEFAVCEGPKGCFVKALEMQGEALYRVSEYQWESFGLSFVKVHQDSLAYSEAQALLRTAK